MSEKVAYETAGQKRPEVWPEAPLRTFLFEVEVGDFCSRFQTEWGFSAAC